MAILKEIVEAKNPTYGIWTAGPADPAEKTYITKTITGIPTGDTGKSIVDLPYGTKYTVTENLTSGWKQVGESYGRTPHKIGDETAGTAENTYTASNAKVNDLTLEKAFADNTPATENYKLFIYQVELTAPSGMKFVYENQKLYIQNSANGVRSEITIDPSTYYDGTNAVPETFYDDAPSDSTNPLVTISNEGGTDNKATFKVHVQKYRNDTTSGSRTVKNLPYGTVYKVTETSTFPTPPENTSWKNLTTTEPHEIGSGTYKETITNGLTGSFDVSKSVTGRTDISDNMEFAIRVVLTAYSTNVDIKDYLTADDLNALTHVSNATYTARNGSTPSKFEFDVKLKGGESQQITGIPYGTTFEITEPDTKGANSSIAVNGGTGSTGRITGSDTAVVTNAYTTMGKLTLKKVLSGDYAEKGVVAYSSDENAPAATKFKFEVELTAPALMTADILKTIVENGSQYTTVQELGLNQRAKIKRVFEVEGNDPTGITIGYLPVGTEYTVTEIDRPDGCEFGANSNGTVTLKCVYSKNGFIIILR